MEQEWRPETRMRRTEATISDGITIADAVDPMINIPGGREKSDERRRVYIQRKKRPQVIAVHLKERHLKS